MSSFFRNLLVLALLSVIFIHASESEQDELIELADYDVDVQDLNEEQVPLAELTGTYRVEEGILSQDIPATSSTAATSVAQERTSTASKRAFDNFKGRFAEEPLQVSPVNPRKLNVKNSRKPALTKKNLNANAAAGISTQFFGFNISLTAPPIARPSASAVVNQNDNDGSNSPGSVKSVKSATSASSAMSATSEVSSTPSGYDSTEYILRGPIERNLGIQSESEYGSDDEYRPKRRIIQNIPEEKEEEKDDEDD